MSLALQFSVGLGFGLLERGVSWGQEMLTYVVEMQGSLSLVTGGS